jgi:hypothetical protein
MVRKSGIDNKISFDTRATGFLYAEQYPRGPRSLICLYCGDDIENGATEVNFRFQDQE